MALDHSVITHAPDKAIRVAFFHIASTAIEKGDPLECGGADFQARALTADDIFLGVAVERNYIVAHDDLGTKIFESGVVHVVTRGPIVFTKVAAAVTTPGDALTAGAGELDAGTEGTHEISALFLDNRAKDTDYRMVMIL